MGLTKHEKDYISKLEKTTAAQQETITLLTEKVDFLTQKLFGRKTEKTSALGIDNATEQVSIFDEPEACAATAEEDEEADEPSLKDVGAYRKRKKPGLMKEKLADIPHEKKVYTLDEEDRFCNKCGSPLSVVGEEFVRTELEFIPAKVRAIDIYRETYECRPCRKQETPHMEKPSVPEPVILHSLATPSTIAHVINQKYVMALPLYRQESEWKQLGVELSRSTLGNWIIVAYRDWLYAVVEHLKKELISQAYLHADETPVQVLNEPGRKNTTKSYMWVYSSIQDAEHPVRIFDYQPGRSGTFPQTFLKGFKGYLHTDAYQGYEAVEDVTRVFCFAHLRRYFVEAMPKDGKNHSASLCVKALGYINKLFEKESDLKGLSPENRHAQRLKKEKPILEAFWAWAESAQLEVLPKTKLGKAFGYAFNQKEGLMNYLDDGNLSISNNLAENSIRPFTIGRKNWLFSGCPKGATASAGVYSLIETAKANGLNPKKYIEFILSSLPGADFLRKPEILGDYMPWNPKIQAICR